MVPTIRVGRPTDIDPVLDLWARAEAEPTHTDDAAALLAVVEHDGSALLVAEDQGVLVGSIIAGWDGWRGSIYRLVVDRSHRRRGLARRLLAGAESHLAEVGAARIQAVVVETEPLATGFWRASGWEQQHHRLRFVSG
jgi:ribosomal protein S18 acetylase RimI-like enzyme